MDVRVVCVTYEPVKGQRKINPLLIMNYNTPYIHSSEHPEAKHQGMPWIPHPTHSTTSSVEEAKVR